MNPQKLWQMTLSELELTVSRSVYQTQFAQCQLTNLENNVATVGCPSSIIKTLIETRYYSLIKSILDRHTQTNISLVFSVSPRRVSLVAADAGPLFASPAPTENQRSTLDDLSRRLHIRPESTFATFAVSTTNQIAYAAATAVAKSPGVAYNPLFFYGGVGVGKTHLMHAVANDLLTRNPRLKTVYCMGEEFLNEIVEAIQTKTARQFKQKYRSAQLLLVDDIQFIAGKQTAQEEFFHTFNAVHREGGQIILTSDRSPTEISKLEDRLRSRFEGGLLVDISQPDFELRAAIVNIKAQSMGLTLPAGAAQMIAGNVSDTRGLEGFLRRLTSEMQARKAEASIDLVSSILNVKPGQNHTPADIKPQKPRSSQEVLQAVADFFTIKPSTLKGPKRDRPIVRSRQMFMYLCRVELGLTLDDIGGAIGGRDHTTILHGVDTMTRELATNDYLRQALLGIKQKLWD